MARKLLHDPALHRALCRFPAGQVATGHVKLGDFARIDKNAGSRMVPVKEAGGTLVPELREKSGPEFVTHAAMLARHFSLQRRSR